MLKLLDFWAPWCGPCKMMNPIIEELKTEFAGKLEIQEINVDEDQELSGKFEVMSIPTYIVMDGDTELGRRVGFTPKPEMVALIKPHIK